MRRLATLTVLLALAVSATADARIVPQQGIKGVTLDMTDRQVRAKLGRPDGIAFKRHEIIGRSKTYRYGLTKILIGPGSGKVLSITTTSRAERTSSGVGVGSTERAVDTRVRNSTCKTEFGLRHCYVGSFRPGRRVTDFFISRTGRVTSVTVGIVID